MFAFHQPVEESVQAAVLDIDVALGELPGFDVGSVTEPPHPVLEVDEIVFDVLGGDFRRIGPALLLGVEGRHGDSSFKAVEVPLGVPVGGLQAAEKPFSVCAKTEVRMLLDGHSSGGT